MQKLRLSLLLVAMMSSATSAARADDAEPPTYRVPVGNSPARGAATAKITLVVFSDFQCPFCARLEPTIAALTTKYGADLRVVWKNNPLPFHQNAKPAATAAIAAAAQGKFWQMHDKLMANQQTLSEENYERFAVELGLNLDAFHTARASSTTEQIIKDDQALAVKVGANGTPTSFVNGRILTGAQPLEVFTAVIAAEGVRADNLLKTGVAPSALYDTLQKTALDQPAAPPSRPSALADDNTILRASIDNAPTRGPANAKVTIVEYTDFQCPFCGRVEPTIAKLLTDYPNDVRLVAKQLPLPFHQNAKLAAVAALAAREQGGDSRYWQMHDKLFANQRALERDSLIAYAHELGLDQKRFITALDDDRLTRLVDKDAAQAAQLGIQGTPSFVINGKKLVGAQPYDAFKNKVDDAIKSANALIASGTAPKDVYAAIMKNAVDKKPSAPAPDDADEDGKFYQVEPGNGPSMGPKDPPVQIVELLDFECPFCARAAATLKPVLDKYGRKIRLTIRNYPLPFHAHARLAAMAGLAAHAQGKFWPMHDLLFANRTALERDDLERYAAQLGLDVSRFRIALDDSALAAKIDEDVRYSQTVMPSIGTPTFFINGRLVSGAQQQAEFERVIDAALVAKAKPSKAKPKK